jgi:hypothetical protein
MTARRSMSVSRSSVEANTARFGRVEKSKATGSDAIAPGMVVGDAVAEQASSLAPGQAPGFQASVRESC